MDFFAISGLLNGLAAIGLASFVYFRAPTDPRHWTFGLVGISTALWSLGYFAWQMSSSDIGALLFLRVLMAGAIFIPITFFHHVAHLLKGAETHSRFIRANYIIGFLFLVLDCTPFFVKGVQAISIFQFWGVPGLAFHVCLIWWFGLVLITHAYLISAFRKETGIRRRQIRNIMIGSGIGFIGGATNFPLWYGIEILPYGTIGFTLYISLVAYALLRFHWLDFSVYVEKGISYFALLLLVSQPIYPILLFAQKSVFGVINVRFAVVQLVVHLLTVAGAYQMRAGSRGSIARTIFKGRESHSRAVNRLTAKASQLQDVSELGQAILEILQKGMGAKKAAIFVLNHEAHRYRAIGSFGLSQDSSIIRDGWSTSDDLPQMLHLNQERISSKDLMNAQSIQGEKGIIKPFDDLGLDWYYPLLENGRLLGFLAFGSGSSKFIDGVGEETFWNAIVQESVMVLENSIMREEIQRFQGMLCQIDRLRSVETMANGLTHELDNPVRSIKAFVQVAQMRRHDGEFMEQLHRIVDKDLESIDALVQEIREYVKPLSASPTKPVHVHDVIDSCLLFIASNPAYHNIMIEKSFSAHAPMILADRQAVLQAFFNGLLFLLKEAACITKTIEIETKTDIHMMGQEWVHVILRWKSSIPLADTQLVSLESLELEGSWSDAHDSSIEQGVTLAHQIIQHHSGDLQILTTHGAVIGFHFQLPAHLSEDLVGPRGSLSFSPHSVKPGQSHSSTKTRLPLH